MEISRRSQLRITRVLNDFLPPSLRDARWFMRGPIRVVFGRDAALAMDFKPTSLSLHDAFEVIAKSHLGFDQLIHERTRDGADWIHLGLSDAGERREVLRAGGIALGGPMTYTRVAMG